jgi:tetratricopeptide (TPR) repeat protein
LGIVVLLAYADSFRAGLIYDNAVLFSQDPRIHAVTAHNLSLILSGGYWYNRPDTGLYRPLTTLSFLLNYAAFGPQPASYHWVNLAMHEINVLLVYALGMLVFARRWPAFALAAIWGLHPLHTEAVTNVVGRADLLAGFGVLAGFLCYIRYSRATGRRRLAWLAGLAAAQTIGIFSKESAAVLPGIMLLYGSMTEQAGWWRQRALPYAAVVLPLAAYLWLRSSLRIHLLPSYIDNPIVAAGFLAGRMTAFEVLGKFVWLFLWPARLSADYSYRAIPVLAWQTSGWGDVPALLTAAILAAVTWFAVARKRSAKALYFFALFFWIAYLPTSNLPIVIGSIMAERFLYLPSIGLAGLAVAAAVRWRGQSRLHLPERVWWGVPAAVCIALGARTYARNLDWRDERSLWTSAVAVSPGSARAHNNLGTALPLEPDRLPEIAGEFQAALRILPDDAEAHNNLGSTLAHMPGRLPDAIAEFQAALRIRPDYAEARNSLGSALLQSPGRLGDAIGEFQAALRIRPDYADAHYNLGTALLEMPDRLGDAIGEFQAALRVRPDYAEAHHNLGVALLEIPGRQAEGIAEFQAAVEIRPEYAEAHNDLGRAYLREPGRLPEAIAQFEAALRSRPGFAEAHYNLGNALLHVPGRREDAIGQYEAGLRLDPDVAEGHYNLANVLLQMPGRTEDAIGELEKALRLKPDFAEAHYNLAMVLRRMPGREAEASRELATALRLRPGLGQPSPARPAQGK